jgi:hypothetical protein
MLDEGRAFTTSSSFGWKNGFADPDCRAMAAHTKVGVGYNIQVAVDAKHKMIVEQTKGGPNSHMVHMFRSDAASR